ncbi:MAG: aminopeptidase [Ignavibacteria bacterium]|nr:aminopeptidase [Ignavibacteria bacterium]
MIMTDLQKACDIAIRDCMGAKAGETVLVVSDTEKHEIAYELYLSAIRLGHKAVYSEMQPLEVNGQEPPAAIADLMKQFDVVLCPTLRSLTHTQARRDASATGARVATFPGITKDVMIRGLNADYKRIAERSLNLKAVLDKGKHVRVTSTKGTDISFSIDGRDAHASKGLFHAKGESGNLPTGETFLAPVEGTAEGVFIVDGSFAGVGLMKEMDIKLTVKSGFVTSVEGGENAKQLSEILAKVGGDAYNIAEFGIGTNDSAQLSGLILEDEKVMGTIHIAVGDNMGFGGKVKVPLHLDGVVKDPDVYLDGELIMKQGKFTIEV